MYNFKLIKSIAAKYYFPGILIEHFLWLPTRIGLSFLFSSINLLSTFTTILLSSRVIFYINNYVFPIKKDFPLSRSTGLSLCTHTNVPLVLPKSLILWCSSTAKCLELTVGALSTCSTYAFFLPNMDFEPAVIKNEIFDS